MHYFLLLTSSLLFLFRRNDSSGRLSIKGRLSAVIFFFLVLIFVFWSSTSLCLSFTLLPVLGIPTLHKVYIHTTAHIHNIYKLYFLVVPLVLLTASATLFFPKSYTRCFPCFAESHIVSKAPSAAKIKNPKLKFSLPKQLNTHQIFQKVLSQY